MEINIGLSTMLCLLKAKNRFIARLQSVETVSGVVGPALGGMLLSLFSLKIGFFVDATTFFLSFIYWVTETATKNNDIHRNKHNVWQGYAVIIKNNNLLLMNVARIVGNYLFALWGVLLPVTLATRFVQRDFPLYQGLSP